MVQRALAAALLLGVLSEGALQGVAADSLDWEPLRTVEGVPVEFRPTDTAFHRHRGRTSVCTDLAALEAFVSDTSRFPEWIPFTRSAHLLDESADVFVFYVRSTTPWPLKDRDMVYQITRLDLGDGGVRLVIAGLPDHPPTFDGVERIREVGGEWLLEPAQEVIRVSYELYVDPGPAPAFFANRRLATVVGRTLASLTARFPCPA